MLAKIFLYVHYLIVRLVSVAQPICLVDANPAIKALRILGLKLVNIFLLVQPHWFQGLEPCHVKKDIF